MGDKRDVQRLVASCSGGLLALRSEDGERLARLGGYGEQLEPDVGS